MGQKQRKGQELEEREELVKEEPNNNLENIGDGYLIMKRLLLILHK